MVEENVQSLQEMNKKDSFVAGVHACLPTILGYLSIGFAAGVVEKTAGLSILEIALISLLMYAGSGQFIAASMIAASYSLTAIVMMIFFINLRHLLMSASMVPYFKNLTVKQNILIGSQITDETFGVATTEINNKNVNRYYWMLGLNLAAYINWVFANILGGLFGELISNPKALGIEFALPAMFAGLLILQLISRGKLRVDFIVIVISITLVAFIHLIIPGSWVVILATIIATTVGMLIQKWK